MPVFDDEGNVTAVLESGMSKVLLDYNIRQEIRYLTVVNMLILAAMMIFIAVILTYGLYPLKRLKRGVEEMLDGHLGVTVPVRGRDEVAEISEVFNRMSRSIQNHFEQMERFNRASFRFIPLRYSACFTRKVWRMCRKVITPPSPLRRFPSTP